MRIARDTLIYLFAYCCHCCLPSCALIRYADQPELSVSVNNLTPVQRVELEGGWGGLCDGGLLFPTLKSFIALTIMSIAVVNSRRT